MRSADLLPRKHFEEWWFYFALQAFLDRLDLKIHLGNPNHAAR